MASIVAPSAAPHAAHLPADRTAAAPVGGAILRPTVVVLSGDPAVRAARAAALAAAGLRVLAVASLHATRHAVASGATCLVLDRRAPDGDALKLVDELYRSGRPLRIVVVTAAESERERVESLVAGADDVVPPQVPAGELVVRVRRLAAPPPAPTPRVQTQRLVIGRLTIDQDRRSVRIDGADVSLSPTQYQILVSLVVERGRAVTARALIERCWDSHRDQASCAVRTQITRLRTALRGSVEIRCVRGEGYRLAPAED